MLNGQIIIKFIECHGKFHVICQGFSGTIYHEMFDSEAAAQDYLTSLNTVTVVLERV